MINSKVKKYSYIIGCMLIAIGTFLLLVTIFWPDNLFPNFAEKYLYFTSIGLIAYAFGVDKSIGKKKVEDAA